MIASSASRILKIPRVGYCGDFGLVAPICVVSLALKAFAGLNDSLLVGLKEHKSVASSLLEFLGLSAGFREDGGGVIAGSIRRLVELVEEMRGQDSALAGLSFGPETRGEAAFYTNSNYWEIWSNRSEANLRANREGRGSFSAVC